MRFTIEGTTQTIEEWAADYGIPCALIRFRLRHGWSADRAVTEPMTVRRGEKLAPDAMVDDEPSSHLVASWLSLKLPNVSTPSTATGSFRGQHAKHAAGHSRRTYTHNGASRTVGEWAEYLGISRQAMHLRLKTKGEEAFTRFVPR